MNEPAITTQPEKPAIQSKTIQGVLLAAIAMVLAQFGYEMPIESIEMTLNEIIEVVGLVYAAWGRIVARTPIKGIV